MHFQTKYDGRLPVWVVTEILDFGSAAHLYRGLKAVDRTAIAQELDIVDGLGRGNGHTLGNWLRVLNYVRNICAHHSRLWNRHMVNKIGARQLAAIPELQHLSAPEVSHHRIYSTLCVLAFLLQRIGQGDWASGVRELITVEIPACGSGLSEMGFSCWVGEVLAVDVTVLCDAVAVFPEGVAEALPGWGVEEAEWTRRVMAGNVREDGWLLHFHSYLVMSDAGVVLVDAGVGPAGGEGAEWLGVAGRLPRLIGQVGVEAADVDAVVLTHVHLDHVGWVSDGVQARFPRAEYVVQRDELEHVRGGSTYSSRIRPIEDAGQLRVVDGEVALRGMRLVPTPGHTPGHQSVVTERAILGGDVLVHPAQARRPELTYVYERDPAVAITSRRDLLALAAATGIPIAAAHPHAPLSVDPTQARLTVSAMAVPAGGEGVCAPYRL